MIEFVRGELAVGRTTMSHPIHGLRVTLYPMFHIGSPYFYTALTEDLSRFHVFLLEGVRWRGWRGPLYDLAARNLGMVSQEKHLHIPSGGERLLLDMSEADFRREAHALPIHWWLLLRLIRPVLWAISLTEGGRQAMWQQFSKKSYVHNLRDTERPLSRLIRTKRDRAMTDRLREFVQDPVRIKHGDPVAVIAGAAHIPALYFTLRECGFEKGNVRWFEVLEGLNRRRRNGRLSDLTAKP